MAVDGENDGRKLTSGPGGINVGGSPNEPLLRSRVRGDAFDRSVLTVDGTQYVGDGTSRPMPLGTTALLGYVSVRTFGAVGNGTADDTAAIQATIDYLTGSADPDTNTRNPDYGIYFPPGTYKITSPIEVWSVQGFHMKGAGPGLTDFLPSGTMDMLFDFDGISRSSIGGFSVSGSGSVAHELTEVIRIHHTTEINRTTNYSQLYDVVINAPTKYVHGIRIGEQGEHTQVDTITLRDITIVGGWTAGENTWWQGGLRVGSGEFSNNLDHKGFNCTLNSHRYNLYMDCSQFALFGFEFSGSEADIYIGDITTYLVVRGGRSETSGRLLLTDTASAPALVSLEDIDWKASSLDADDEFIKWLLSGCLYLKNIRAINPPTSHTPKVRAVPSAGAHLDVIIDGIVVMGGTLATTFISNSNSQISGRGYTSLDSTTGLIDATNSVKGEFIIGEAVTQVIRRTRRSAEAADRFQMLARGVMMWGDGTNAPDTGLERVGANKLGTSTGDDFAVANEFYIQDGSSNNQVRGGGRSPSNQAGFSLGSLSDVKFGRLGAARFGVDSDVEITVAGKGLRVKEGSNAKQGTSTLVAGTVTVSNTSVTANSRILLTVQSLGTVTAPKAIAVTARTASTSFTITSEDATDTSVVAWQIFEPA